TLIGRQLIERQAKIAHVEVALLVWMYRKLGGLGAVDLAAALAAFRKVGVAQDRKQPSPQVRARLEALQAIPCLEQGFLHEIIGTFHIAAQRNRKCTQIGNEPQERFLERRGLGIHRGFSCVRRASTSLLRRSGSGSCSMSANESLRMAPMRSCSARSSMPAPLAGREAGRPQLPFLSASLRTKCSLRSPMITDKRVRGPCSGCSCRSATAPSATASAAVPRVESSFPGIISLRLARPEPASSRQQA